MNSTTVFTPWIGDIRVADTRRPAGDLTEMIASIREVGLLNPITVNEDADKKYTLIAGRHRLEACRALGWEKIPANVVTMDDLHAELAEIDENLVNNPPGALARGELWARRKEIYEGLHPETKAGVAGGKASGVARSEKGTTEIISVVPPAPTFTADAAAKTGVTPRTIRQEVQIAEDIIPEVKAMIRDTPVADRKTDLLAIARTPGEEQRMEALSRIAQRDQNNEAAYRAQRNAMRQEREREEAEAAAQEQMVIDRADVDGIFARNKLRADYRKSLAAAMEFFALNMESIIPMLADADRTFLDAEVLMIRRWCDRVETLRKPHLQIVGGDRRVEVR